jgi:hypothetical protein
VFGQAPQKMTYQSVVRDTSDQLIANQVIGMQINILQGSATGTSVYTETQTTTTNINGLLSIEFGGQAGFDTITWANGPYFIETNIDVTGGSSYTITGVSQLLTVPYALHAKTAESIEGGTSLAIGDSYQGGTIFWLDSTGQHGLIATPMNQTAEIRWYAGSYGKTQAKGDGLYAGKANTAIAIASHVALGDDNYNYAARICNELQITENGVTYGDWYLPSKYELNLLYLHKDVVSGLSDYYYWSSTEMDGASA